ncbi:MULTISPECIES: DUF642 domain-containing protein [unclassified Pseudoalteromonas]|uniref:DUF642 domain-containing protein n=1 Tax=unclassified Pseudoalteromonas TaxID=194690 RepID=UPI000C068A13|nr:MULTISPECIES: DUF642 domain-containing protein [unclassified Pseudoalteromonas]MDP2635256.1 DUF642 domain-containing protein [Pseudoalteromonas sp. 1_MG-2023]PHN90923.1 hemolysin-type calcium-binding protein [Pseudoalteromonas sp. 3D05]
MKNSTFKLAALPLLLASSFTMASSNLVVNGSFEDTAQVSGTWSLFNKVPGWQRSDNAKFEIQTTALNIVPSQDGTQYIELDSTANYSVFQTLETQPQQNYEISFYYSARRDGDETTNKAKVYWDGELLDTLNATSRGWQKFTYTVKANSNSSELKFVGAGKSDSYGAFIDDVKVSTACASGLYGINNFGSNEEGYVYFFNTNTNTYSTVAGLNNTASNIASHNGVLYFMEQLDRSTKVSQILSLDLANNQQSLVSPTKSYPIYRSAMSADGTTLRATSKTYMYDFDLATGDKTVLGKLTYPGDSFSHGDIAYSADNNVLYVLTGKALYTVDQGSLELSLIGEHNVNWASGIAIADDGAIYVSGRESGENAKIYQLNQNTAEATFVMEGPSHLNDLTFVDGNYCN